MDSIPSEGRVLPVENAGLRILWSGFDIKPFSYPSGHRRKGWMEIPAGPSNPFPDAGRSGSPKAGQIKKQKNLLAGPIIY